MARRAFTITAAALTATTALLLTGCGGDESPDDIKGAESGSPSPSASAPATAAPGAKRPEITLPSSFRLAFQDWKSDKSEEQAVLNDGKEELRSGYAAIIDNDLDSEALVFYHTTSGLSQAQQWIKTYTDKNLTVIGDLPVYDPEVVLGSGGGNAVLNYCTDESKASTKNLKTGEVQGNPPGTAPEVFYSVSMTKNEQGVWQTVSVRSERGGCQR
ncbi:hypothetical protein [Streptomyces sp. I4(2020)]|uniref:hypothetical protein n=1 Tax=Streptomyces sp. I4(2020) TaxID=2760981 RepID=UPI0018EEAD3A|nr:hypothetical protein [Streptomyces sp. I4(2020)]MBJ6615317.1 hypothetical protein [Streptomyces sp. I3(2020)]MBJ6625776.1 hypothetical protein [Streptomyces sp. I4(2020)]